MSSRWDPTIFGVPKAIALDSQQQLEAGYVKTISDLGGV